MTASWTIEALYVYMCMYTHTHIHLYTYTHTCTHTHIHIYTYTHIHICTYTHIHTESSDASDGSALGQGSVFQHLDHDPLLQFTHASSVSEASAAAGARGSLITVCRYHRVRVQIAVADRRSATGGERARGAQCPVRAMLLMLRGAPGRRWCRAVHGCSTRPRLSALWQRRKCVKRSCSCVKWSCSYVPRVLELTQPVPLRCYQPLARRGARQERGEGLWRRGYGGGGGGNVGADAAREWNLHFRQLEQHDHSGRNAHGLGRGVGVALAGGRDVVREAACRTRDLVVRLLDNHRSLAPCARHTFSQKCAL